MSGFYWDSANPTPVIEFSLSAGALTVSTSGVCKVLFPKQGSPGLMQEIDLSGRSYTIASGAMIGRHGTTPSVAWGSAMPLFVYLVNSNNTAAGVQISLSRDPRASLTPASEDNIGIAGSAAAVSAQGNHFQSGAAKLENVPCLCLGSLTATIDDSAGGVFTFGALSSTDGFGKFQEGVRFTLPVGQGGASAGKYFYDNAGTAPTFSANTPYYWVHKSGAVDLLYYFSGNTATDGAGAVSVAIAAPYMAGTTSTQIWFGSGRLYTTGAGAADVAATYMLQGTTSLIYIPATGGSSYQNTIFQDGDRTVRFTLSFQAF